MTTRVVAIPRAARRGLRAERALSKLRTSQLMAAQTREADRPSLLHALFKEPAAQRARLVEGCGSTTKVLSPHSRGAGPGLRPGREARDAPGTCVLLEAYFPALGRADARGRPPFPAQETLPATRPPHA